MVARHTYKIFLIGGLLFLSGALTGWIGGGSLPPAPPVPYTFDLDEGRSGFRQDGYHLAGVVNKLEDCRRLEQPAGFVVRVSGSAAGEAYNAEWRSVLGRSRDESRPVGSDDMHIVIDLPEAFVRAEVWTAHACPSPEIAEVTGASITYVRTLLHDIPGNVVSQRALSSAEQEGN